MKVPKTLGLALKNKRKKVIVKSAYLNEMYPIALTEYFNDGNGTRQIGTIFKELWRHQYGPKPPNSSFEKDHNKRQCDSPKCTLVMNLLYLKQTNTGKPHKITLKRLNHLNANRQDCPEVLPHQP